MTSPSAPACATHPQAAASRVEMSAVGTTTIPAIWATPMSGIARKLSARPANVMREKTIAPIGNNSASVAIEAASMAAGARAIRGSRQRCTTGTTRRIASVAPNVSTNAGSVTDSGSAATRHAATSASVLRGELRWSTARAAK